MAVEPETQAEWYETVSALPAVQAAWEQRRRWPTDEKLAIFGEQLEDAKSPPPIPTWEEIAAELNTELEKATPAGQRRGRRQGDAGEGRARVGDRT